MPDMKDRIQMIANRFKQNSIPMRLEEYETFKEKKFNPLDDLLHEYRLIAVADYLKSKKASDFIQNLQKAIDYKLLAYQERLNDGYTLKDNTIYGYDILMHSLALGDKDRSLKILDYLKEAPIKGEHPFARHFFMAISNALWEKEDGVEEQLDEMRLYFEKKYKSWTGYPKMFLAIHQKDQNLAQQGIEEIMKGYPRLCATGKFFGDTIDEIIAFFPLGMLNLARMKGLDVMIDSAFIPKDLIA